ncbi:MAG: NADH-quinone oxidoreductase subunit NuoE [Eubacteriales bacterium]|nr:NADH-quinone oxidoreductase subunit NuoE [Eubacteriales bacterium]
MDKVLEKEKFQKLDELIAQYKDKKGPLMPVMQHAQEIFGYLPLEVQSAIADGLNVPLTDVYGVATFYSQFVLEPKGDNTVSICLGTACYVKGASKVFDRVQEELGVAPGKTTADGKFTLLATRCLGCCGLAPVMMINDDVYGRLTPDVVKGILDKYRGA